MANDGASRVTLGTLDTQVRSLDRDYQDFKRQIANLDNKVDASIAFLGNKIDASISALGNKFEQRQTPLVAIIGTAIAGFIATSTLLGGIGALVYGPIQRDTSRLDSAVSAILERGIFQRAYDADQSRNADTLRVLRADVNGNIQQQRYNADQERLTHTLDELRARFASKTEMEATFRERQQQISANSTYIENLRNRSYDHLGRLTKAETSVTDLERRFDAVSRRLAEFIRDSGKH